MPPNPAPRPLPPGPPPCDVAVVTVTLDLPAAALADLEPLLSAAERGRATRLSPVLRRRFVAGRGQLRRLLARVVGDDPAALAIEPGPRGKPAVVGRHAGRCHFNVSHSGDHCLVALSSALPLGVDLECRTPAHTPAWADMMSGSILAGDELDRYHALAERDRAVAVLEAWVAKEAILKATSEGVAGGVRHVVLPPALPRVSLAAAGPTTDADLASVVGGAAGSWGVCLLQASTAGFAAVACPITAASIAIGGFGPDPPIAGEAGTIRR